MSLNWTLPEDWERFYYESPIDEPIRGINKGDKCLRGDVNTIILLTPAVGLGEITENNWTEFYARVKFLESLDGPFFLERDETVSGGFRPKYTPPELIYELIGLSTNVSRETWGNWTKRILKEQKRRWELEATKTLEPANGVR